MKRLFIAIPLPERIRVAIADRLHESVKVYHWMPPKNLHLTFKFIGAVDSSLEALIKATLADINTTPFTLPIEGIGSFTARQRPTVLWIGVGTGHPQLFSLQKSLEDRLLAVGIEVAKRLYHPHITVAYCKQAAPETIRQFIKRHRDFATEPFRVDGYALYSSILTSEGPLYS